MRFYSFHISVQNFCHQNCSFLSDGLVVVFSRLLKNPFLNTCMRGLLFIFSIKVLLILVVCAWESNLTRPWCNEHWNVLHPSPWLGTLCLKCRYWALKRSRTPPQCILLVFSQFAVYAPACLRGFFCQEGVFALAFSSAMHAPVSCDSPEWHSHGRVPARQLPVCPLTD